MMPLSFNKINGFNNNIHNTCRINSEGSNIKSCGIILQLLSIVPNLKYNTYTVLLYLQIVY